MYLISFILNLIKICPFGLELFLFLKVGWRVVAGWLSLSSAGLSAVIPACFVVMVTELLLPHCVVNVVKCQTV